MSKNLDDLQVDKEDRLRLVKANYPLFTLFSQAVSFFFDGAPRFLQDLSGLAQDKEEYETVQEKEWATIIRNVMKEFNYKLPKSYSYKQVN